MSDLLYIFGPTHAQHSGVLVPATNSIVSGKVCFLREPICCSEPQWDMLPRFTGIAIPANVIRRDGAFNTRTPSQPMKPMSSKTRHFIKGVLVPILVARYIAERRGEGAARGSEEMP